MHEYDTHRNRRNRLGWWSAAVVGLGLVVGATTWTLLPTEDPLETEPEQSSTSLFEWFSPVDAVVRVNDVTATGEQYELPGAHILGYTSRLESVLYVSDQYPEALPTPGARLLFGDPTEAGLEAFLDTELVIFLAHVLDDEGVAEGARWGVRLVAVDSLTDGLEFVDPIGRRFNKPVDDLASELPRHLVPGIDGASFEFEMMVAWAQEMAEVNAPVAAQPDLDASAYGPITQWFLGNIPNEARWADWYAAPPTQRPLSYGQSPPEVIEGLSEYHILIDIPDTNWDQELMVLLRTPLGVCHAAFLTAGPHPAVVLTDGTEGIEVVITTDSQTYAGPVVTTIAPDARESFAILLEIGESVVAAAVAEAGASRISGTYDVVTGISGQEFASLTESFAERQASQGG